MDKTLHWSFPLPRTHTGMLMGNGVLGVMVWGEGNVLRITVNRGDFWDHRGGKEWTDQMSFDNIRDRLERNDRDGLLEAFKIPTKGPREPERPSLLPLGRVELVFPGEWRLTTGRIELSTGTVVASLSDGRGTSRDVKVEIAMDRPVLWLQHDAGLPFPEVRIVTCWQYPKLAEKLVAIGFVEPEKFEEDGWFGWVQSRVAAGDRPLCVMGKKDAKSCSVALSLEYGADVASARAEARSTLQRVVQAGRTELQRANGEWWKRYWADVPRLQMPDADLDFLYHYGMYKFAGLTNPSGLAAGLQGPWIEEYQLPPWSGDYHFNINVQMCYQPAYAGNRLANLKPMLDLIQSWMPILRDNAKKFVGINDGLVLPHAVDDRCRIIGAFWTGTIDHGCTAWVGKMMFDYWQFGGGDDAFLRQTVYPFLHGAMRVYEEMLDRDASGAFSLPISVSPEYRGAAMNAWGRNASFQLACIHWLIGALRECCRVLGETPRPIWGEIEKSLPMACVEGEPQRQRIHLWSGTDLEESHRHHSHLAGITPFDVIDPNDSAWKDVVAQSINHWIRKGMGLWSGWCMPWASALHQRVGNVDMSVIILKIWKSVFTNTGHGTLHDCQFAGLTLMGISTSASQETKAEIMQMDGGMGVTATLLEGMAQARKGMIHLFAGAPKSWMDVSFSGVRCPGAFLVSATRQAGQVSSVTVVSERGGEFKLANPWPAGVGVRSSAGQLNDSASVLILTTKPGESITLTPES